MKIPSEAILNKLFHLPPFVYFIAFLAALVIGFNLYLVYRSTVMHQDVVSDRYYEDGLKYDSALSAQKRIDSLGLSIAMHLTENQTSVQWSGLDSSGLLATGKQSSLCQVTFYRPGNRDLDRQLILEVDSLVPGKWKSPSPMLKSGLWNITVRWYRDTTLWLEKSFRHSA